MGERCKDAWRKNPVPLHRLSPGGGQYFFGYYDLFATSGNMHLCHRVPFIDRLHRAGDRAQLGTLPLTGGEFTPFDDTAAWCFQQGAMMQFVPGLPDTVLYNVEHKDGYGARMRNLRTGAAREYGRPVSALSPDGTFFLSVNMARLYDFRPGYGYAGIPDPYGSEAAPRTDGVWRVDMGTGRETLLVTLATLQKLAGDYFVAGEKLCINHITVAPGGRRYVMLLRNMEKRPWRTLVLTADCGGAGEPFVILDDTYALTTGGRTRIACFSTAGSPDKTTCTRSMTVRGGLRRGIPGTLRSMGTCAPRPAGNGSATTAIPTRRASAGCWSTIP